MLERKIRLNAVADVKEFVRAAEKCEYDVDIFYSNERVKTYHFTGHMEKYENIETILNAISKMVGVHFTIKEKTIIVTE